MGPIALTVPLVQVETVMLASVRFAAFFVLAPPFSHRAIPAQVKVALSLGLALAVSPRIEPLADDSTPAFVAALVAQALVGAALGFGVLMVFSALQSAGGFIDIFGGFQVSSGYDPLGMTSGAVFQRFYQLLALVLLFVSDGYLVVLGGLVRTFDALPVDAILDPGAVAENLAGGVGQLFLAALQIAGPMVVVLFLADVGLGLLTRVAPALNAFALGFPLKVLLTLIMSGFAVVGLPHVVEALTGRSVADLMGVLP